MLCFFCGKNMATSLIGVTEGAGKNIATNSISEDATTKQVQRIVNNDSTGAETGVTSNPLITKGAQSTAPAVGQAKIAVSGTAVQLGSNATPNGVVVTALSSNGASITVGGSGVTNTVDGTGNGYIIEPGGSGAFAVTNTNALYINGFIGDIVSFAGS